MNIDIERYPRTMVAKPISASNFVEKKDGVEDSGEGPSTKPAVQNENDAVELAYVRNERAYFVKDEEDGEKEIDREELEKGYMYGRAVVPISSTDETVTILETNPSYEILGFVPRQGVGSHLPFHV